MIGIVLAGGQSLRFGRDKATCQLPGQKYSNVQLAVNKLSACEQIIVCANRANQGKIKSQLGSGITIVCDLAEYANHGPLAAIATATSLRTGDVDYQTLPVDYPNLTPATVNRIAAQPNTVAATVGHAHYTIAHFRCSHRQVVNWLAHGDWRLRHFIIDCCHCQPLLFPDSHEFINLNYDQGEHIP
ncbi:hypothetical protein HMPREF9102_1486 [Limosilactobacillus oris F0423]|uniref:MobA-like NTP transferase domain-containing protein n=1 Tax=Limosilactobacillus oris F0423 TaxID=944562 RepID=A0ABP2L9H3_9LACO|nr:molybdenum cofactor guanylyltransferase [Limosilactobacillus oris]EGS37353.1 hypothetical protein HMPREF9102_1486 [Limosilactobacillus oris F0423]